MFIRWHLSTREYPEPTTLRTDLGSVEVAALDAMESSYKSLQITGPSDPGLHVFSACVDTFASEAVTTNNCASLGRIKVGADGFPGLVPDLSAWLSPVRDDRPIKTIHLVAGEQFALEAGAINYGTASSPETTLRYLRSTDETISPTDIEVGSAIAKALDIGEGRRPGGDAHGAVDRGHLLLRGVRGCRGGRTGCHGQLLAGHARHCNGITLTPRAPCGA